MFGAIAGLVGDMAFAGMDAQILHDGLRQMREHRWGHLPFGDVIARSDAHKVAVHAHKQHYAPVVHRLYDLMPAEAARLRGDVRDLLRENAHLSAMIALKRRSVETKIQGPLREERLTHLDDAQRALTQEQKIIEDGLKEFAALYSVSKSEAMKTTLKNANAALQRFAYRRRIVAGSAMAAVAIGIPLLMLYQTVKSAQRDASGYART